MAYREPKSLSRFYHMPAAVVSLPPGKHVPQHTPRASTPRSLYTRSLDIVYEASQRKKQVRALVSSFERVDSDQDGIVNKKQFRACMREPTTQEFFRDRFDLQPHQVDGLFRLFDADGGGTMNIKEWKRACIHLVSKQPDGRDVKHWTSEDVGMGLQQRRERGER
eukprot:TRINITY_DN44973_c0_g1_i1.p1 TRINITY_DN44973_c0_g1~~TRINITY_DN44973_c0_g1_i1.p1  ORF type:complete len:165 (+),score=30.08 TRINITY_DN44973_c0_g1_i1:114-608(+)